MPSFEGRATFGAMDPQIGVLPVRTTVFLSAALLAALTACSTDKMGTTAPDATLSARRADDADAARRGNDHGGTVYVLSNNTTANAVLVYPRHSDGTLGTPSSIPTGGRGTGAGLGNQYGLVLDDEGEMLFGVDAGSDEISAFRVDDGSVRQTDRVASGGNQPISIAVSEHLVYVLNDGANANISGFRLTERGKLIPIPGSTRARSASAGSVDGAEIAFSPDGRSVVVTEKAANLIVTYPVLRSGLTGAPIVTRSSGRTPFGFDFTPWGTLVVSEAVGGAAGASTVSSYGIDRSANLSLVSASVPTAQSAVCWIVVTADGRTAYAANAGTASVSSFNVARSGALGLIAGVAGSTGAGSAPTDMALSRGDRFLYVRNGGNRTISIFATGDNGALAPVATVTDVPAGSNGIAAR
jgi:6-phosphogluconolactonase (cycloisomerase 2 family)